MFITLLCLAYEVGLLSELFTSQRILKKVVTSFGRVAKHIDLCHTFGRILVNITESNTLKFLFNLMGILYAIFTSGIFGVSFSAAGLCHCLLLSREYFFITEQQAGGLQLVAAAALSRRRWHLLTTICTAWSIHQQTDQ